MIKFNRAAANQSVMAPDAPIITIPNGDWAIGFILGLTGITTGDNPQYLISTGNFGASASFNVVYFTSGYNVAAQQGRLAVYADTQTTQASSITSANAITQGYHLVIVQRSGGTVTMRRCEITGAARSTADVVAEGSSSGANFIATLNGTGLRFGSRLDDIANRKSDQAQGRTFMITGTLTDGEVVRLANGEEITALDKTIAYYSRMSSVSDVADQGPNGVAFSVVGSPTTSDEPPYATAGEPPDEEPPAVANMISVTAPAAERIFQRTGTSANVQIAGAYAGADPVAIEYRLYADDGVTAVSGWTAVGATVGTGVWTATASVPQGGKLRIAVRSKAADGVVLATSEPAASRFAIGDLFGVIGSSSAEKLFDSTSGSGYAVAANTSRLAGSPASWSTMSTLGAGTLLAANLAAKGGVPVGMLDYGVGGTTIAQWLVKTGTNWSRFAAAVAAAGGKLAAVYITVGSNDAYAGSITSRAAHLMNMRALVANVRELTGQPNLPVLWSGSNNRPALDAVQANRLRMAECDIGNDPNVWHMQTTDFAVSSDNIHLTPAGFAASVQRASYVMGEALYNGSYRRGPKISSIEYLGDEALVTVVHGNGGDIAPSIGATGFAVTDGIGVLSIAAVERASATSIRLKLDRAVSPPVAVTYQSGGAPDISIPVFDNGASALPLLVETDLFATERTSAPPVQDEFDATKVAQARKVVFPGGTRVVVFGGPATTYPGGPYQKEGRWTIEKHPLDEVYCVADISFDLTESQTTAASVIAVAEGVKVLEQPVVQGALIPVKVGGLDELSGAANFCTLRVTLANGERIDRTIWFAADQGVWTLAKDPDDMRYFVADVGRILADSATQIAGALEAIPVGVTVLEEPVAKGALLMVKLGGMDVTADSVNYCTFPFLCANGEKFFRTIHFERMDN